MKLLILALYAAGLPLWCQYKTQNPQVTRIVAQVSEDRITANLKKLESFGTRFVMSSQDDPARGIGAARRWIAAELRRYSPRLDVAFEQFRVKKIDAPNSRLTQDTELFNIVATLTGRVHPEQRVMITAHYDTLNLAESVKNPNADAPGVTDDGSGVACVMELARILSQYEFEKTLVFVAFAGEEEGLLGSSLSSAKAVKDGVKIEALLNNDIIGSEESGAGRKENRRVNVFSADPNDSPQRTVARYVREIAERYVPSMRVELVFRGDRVGRGGDHTPFALEGFAAVRLSSAVEDYSHQHTATDTFEHTSVPYIAWVTRVNGAAAAALASAPVSPGEVQMGGAESRYDARIRWTADPKDTDVAGYVVVTRPTTSAYWEREIFVGNVTEFVLRETSADETVFGVKAVDRDGNESLVSPVIPVMRVKRVVETF